MYKCDKCNDYSYVVVIKDAKQVCGDCISPRSPKMEARLEPPLGYMGDFHKQEILMAYSCIGTRLYVGMEH